MKILYVVGGLRAQANWKDERVACVPEQYQVSKRFSKSGIDENKRLSEILHDADVKIIMI